MFFGGGGGGFPFGGFGDDDDMPGFMGGGPRKEVDSQRFYDLLGVDKKATQAEIKKAFRQRALKSHPDKGGDPEVFKELNLANEWLSDPKKRDLYDKYGEDALKDGGGGGGGHGDIADLFGGMFGGGGRGG
jgi:DnaJ family protein A protein 2